MKRSHAGSFARNVLFCEASWLSQLGNRRKFQGVSGIHFREYPIVGRRRWFVLVERASRNEKISVNCKDQAGVTKEKVSIVKVDDLSATDIECERNLGQVGTRYESSLGLEIHLDSVWIRIKRKRNFLLLVENDDCIFWQIAERENCLKNKKIYSWKL